jgi:hypothetical protein
MIEEFSIDSNEIIPDAINEECLLKKHTQNYTAERTEGNDVDTGRERIQRGHGTKKKRRTSNDGRMPGTADWDEILRQE